MKDSPIVAFAKAVIKGFGQVMLQGNVWTGLLFIGAIFYDSTLMGVAAVVSNIIGTLTARVAGFKQEDIEEGLYGFNATLVGVALVFYFQQNVWVWLAIAIGSVLATLFMGWGVKKKIPLFTFPFIAVTWIALYVLSIPGLALESVPGHFVDIKAMDDFLIEGHAFGEVMFQGSITAGVIFFIGVFLSSPIGALYGLFAVLISVSISHGMNESQELITEGLMSFNAVLCGIALAGPKVKDGIYVLIAVVLSTYIDHLMIQYGWTTLTFPFVFATWIVVLLKKGEEKFLPNVGKEVSDNA